MRALGTAVVWVQVLDELGAGGAERDGPGGGVAVGVALLQNGAGEVADWIFRVSFRSATRFGEAWRVLPPAPGRALGVADPVSVSYSGMAGRGPTGGRVTRRTGTTVT